MMEKWECRRAFCAVTLQIVISDALKTDRKISNVIKLPLNEKHKNKHHKIIKHLEKNSALM